MAPLAMGIREGTASIAEQRDYLRRLITAGEWLQRHADGLTCAAVEGEMLANESLARPA
jgi:hypothetical protein